MFERVRFQQADDRVVVVKGGSLVLDLEWKAALEFGQALIAQARKAEEWANKDKIVIDQAILLRSGSPLPLTAHPEIQAEALKQSRWNWALRRYMPARRMPEKIGRLQVKRG